LQNGGKDLARDFLHRRHEYHILVFAVWSAEMSRNTSVVIGDKLADFVDRQVAEGRYGSASDVVRAGLRLLEEQETKLAALRAALIEGEESGAATPFDMEAFLARKRKEAGA
jgi:antitoxin ParD1/3/4